MTEQRTAVYRGTYREAIRPIHEVGRSDGYLGGGLNGALVSGQEAAGRIKQAIPSARQAATVIAS